MYVTRTREHTTYIHLLMNGTAGVHGTGVRIVGVHGTGVHGEGVHGQGVHSRYISAW